MCVPVVKKTPCKGGNHGKHVHGGEVLRSRKHHRQLEAVIRDTIVGDILKAAGLVGGGNIGQRLVGVRLGDVGPLAGSVAVPVLHTRAGEARVDKGRILSLFDEVPRVCFKECPIRIRVQCANP